MVTRATKSSEAKEASESKKQEAEGKLGRRRERREGPSSSRLSPVSLSAISLSPVLPSLDSTDWRGITRSLQFQYPLKHSLFAFYLWVLCLRWIDHFWFPSGLCIKTSLNAQPLIWKWFLILMQIKLIFTREVVHLASFWKWGFLELGSGLLF